MQHYQAQAKLREAMTSDGKLQHGQEEAKQKSLETPRQTTLQRVENAASHQKGREAQWEHHLLPYCGESVRIQHVYLLSNCYGRICSLYYGSQKLG